MPRPDFEEVAKRYIQARYWMLREGDLGRHGDALTPLLKAEEDLFEAVTGKRDLIEAMQTFKKPMSFRDGGNIGASPEPLPGAKKLEVKKTKKALPQAQLKTGFFSD